MVRVLTIKFAAKDFGTYISMSYVLEKRIKLDRTETMETASEMSSMG